MHWPKFSTEAGLTYLYTLIRKVVVGVATKVMKGMAVPFVAVLLITTITTIVRVVTYIVEIFKL